jgi:two-component system, NtrC family, sensor kinase
MSGERILVADDRRENLLFLANSVLRPEGYDVITAVDGKQALDKALAERPDLIITDLKMPRMSGLDLMAALRKAGADTPVILTTFYGSEQTAIQAFRLGARDYIIKPYDVKEMLESVERALIERRLRRETSDLQEDIKVSEHLEERVRQLHSLCGIGHALTSLRDPDEVMRVAVEAAIYLTEAEGGQLFLLASGTDQLEVRAIRGPADVRARCVQQRSTDRLASQVARTGRAVIAERENDGEKGASRLAVPLRLHDQVMGVLGVDAKASRPFGENDRYQLGLLASFVAAAVSNAQIIEELRSKVSAEPASPPAPDKDSEEVAAVINEGRELARELQKMAATAQALAEKLQARTGARGAAG